MLSSEAPFPRLYPNIIQEWLPQLGDKAFLAWLHFHSWTTERINQENSFLLPLSLNKIIRRLKTGKVTFYEKVLRPLLDFGLISLQPATHSKQEMHLIVYSSPIDLSSSEEVSLNLPQAESNTPQFEPDHKPSPSASENEKNSLDQPDDLLLIEKTISEDHRLTKKHSNILYAYNQCKNHPRFDREAFIQKMKTCIEYQHHNFGAYLLSSLKNEWNKSSSPPPLSSTRQPTHSPTFGIPPWIVEQEKRQQEGQPREEEKLDPVKQAIVDDYLRKLGF